MLLVKYFSHQHLQRLKKYSYNSTNIAPAQYHLITGGGFALSKGHPLLYGLNPFLECPLTISTGSLMYSHHQILHVCNCIAGGIAQGSPSHSA